MDESRLKSWIVKILPSKEAEQAEGTGFWAAPGGYVLTCSHVVKEMNPPYWVAYGEEKAPAEIIAQEGDITLLHVQEMAGEAAPLGEEWQCGDTIDSVGYQYEGLQGGRISYFPMKSTILGPAELDDREAIALEEAIHIKPGASGAPALNRRTGKIIGIISDKWEPQQVAFVLPLRSVLDRWEVLTPRFQPVDYAQEDIFDYYDTFVGREKEIEAVRELLQGEGGDYLLIQGKAGMGKTALVAELARQVVRKELSPQVSCGVSPQVSCLVFFIRQEGGRNTPETFLDTLNHQLLELLGEREEVPVSLAEKKQQYRRLWKKVETQASARNRLLVLIDGLDESAREGKQPLAEYFPPKIAPYIYWVLTSRPLPEVLSTMSTTHSLRQARSLWLAGLGPEEVRELLRQSDDQIERSDAFIQRLLTHTNGEPLFLRFLCQDIARWGAEAEAYLQETPQEVNEYFLRQFRLLREYTKGAYDRELPLDILKTLLVAYSGMTVQELSGVLQVEPLAISENLEAMERFLLGKVRYELMHLEFRRTVEEKLFRGEEDKQKFLEERLLTYCAKHWRKDKPPKETYALRYYLRHLWELKRYGEMFALCKAGYLEEKLGRLISPELLEEDYRALYQVCKELGDLEGLLYWGVRRARISDEVIVLRDIKKMPQAIGKIAQRGSKEWWERGVGLCALISGAGGKVQGFLGLCEGLEPGDREAPAEVFERVWDLLREMPFGTSKDDLITRYVKELCRWEGSYLGQALQAARQLRDEEERSEALGAIAQGYAQLGEGALAVHGLEQVLQVARQISNEGERSKALGAIAQGYAQIMKAEEIYGLLTNISADKDFLKVCEALLKAGENLSDNKARAFFIHALYRLLPLASSRSRRVYLQVVQQALPFLIKYLPPEQVRPILAFLAEQWQPEPMV